MGDNIHNAKLYQYADDSQLQFSFSPHLNLLAQQEINENLDRLYNFAKDHTLKINTSKSFALIFGSKVGRTKLIRENITFKINNEKIPIVHEVKNLGIHIDCDLNFQTHITNKTKLAYSRLKGLYPYKNCLPSTVKYQLCESLIMSLFDYGVWCTIVR